MQSSAQTVDQYLKKVPAKRLAALNKLRQLCQKYLPDHEEALVYKMPSYIRNGQVEVGFASRKQYISLYFLIDSVMRNKQDRLKDLNTGKGCIRYPNPDEIDYELITDLLIETVETGGTVC
jgi:uncharacterized protein YdhG (YjbR/CyaY superfamily)